MTEKEDFIIRDKRFASQEEPASDKAEDAAPDTGPDGAAPGEKEASETGNGGPEAQLPQVNFATFIFSLNSSALVHLGLIEDPATQKKVKNLPLAKQTIDILGMLEEKTLGNLTEDEEKMLKNILYDLRIIYVKEKG